MARRFSPETQGVAKARYAAGYWKRTGAMPLWLFQSNFSTIQVFPHMYGFSQTARKHRDMKKCNLSMPLHSGCQCARALGRSAVRYLLSKNRLSQTYTRISRKGNT